MTATHSLAREAQTDRIARETANEPTVRSRNKTLLVLTLVSFCGICLRPNQAAEPDPALAALPRADQQAIAALRKVGARVLLNPRQNPAGDDLREKLPRVEIVIGREWSGGDDDLKQARALSTLDRLSVIGSERVTDKALDAFRKIRPTVIVARRSAALLGVSGRKHEKGVEVAHVLAGSAAELAGIREGDVLLELADRPLPSFDALQELLVPLLPRERVTIKLARDNKTLAVVVELGEWR